MAGNLHLPLIDLSSPDHATTSKSIRQACLEYGFFYLINHGVEEEMKKQVFDESRKFFALPIEEKMKLEHDKNHRGYTPLYSETLDPSVEGYGGDFKESFYIGPMEDGKLELDLNQWPSKEVLPTWREAMQSYHEKILIVGRKLVSLIALALDLDEDFFEKGGALHEPMAFLRLLHYPGHYATSGNGLYGASAHSDYGMITLLVTNGVPGLQICREKDKLPQVWEDVHDIDGSFIVNIGDMLERWTNGLFRSTLHRVLLTGSERYSVLIDSNSSILCISTMFHLFIYIKECLIRTRDMKSGCFLSRSKF